MKYVRLWLGCLETFVASLMLLTPNHRTWCSLIGCKFFLRCQLAQRITFIPTFFSYPDYTPILIRAVELWAHDPSVTTPVLKFFSELVQNRSQRLQFDVSSPDGILLFRETSKLICCYGKLIYKTMLVELNWIWYFFINYFLGSRILAIDCPKEQAYPMRLKGISVCFLMLKAILCGNYVNFGVFKLYGDNALDNVLNTTTKMILSIPHSDLLVS